MTYRIIEEIRGNGDAVYKPQKLIKIWFISFWRNLYSGPNEYNTHWHAEHVVDDYMRQEELSREYDLKKTVLKSSVFKTIDCK